MQWHLGQLCSIKLDGKGSKMKNFEGFGLSEELNKSLVKMEYTAPTPIQAQAIPLALKGRDVLGSAQTGTGKTAAFSIPLIETLLNNPSAGALVMTPTRELAKQVLNVIHQLLGYKSKINTAFIIGGAPMGKQLNELRAKPRIIVGTPGRINDHLERGTIKLDMTSFLVLDETDRMLDMGFGVQLDRIIKFLPRERQTLMFSATLPKEIVKLSSKYLNNPERISVGQTNVVAKNIQTDVIRIDQSEKYKELTKQLEDRTGSVIVFIKTKHGADRMAKNLRRDGFTAEALHGDLRQTKRDKVMQNFRKQNFRILIATDIAARGLDVPHIEHVVNYDLPQVAEDYIHRMGRTARAGASGSALSFVSAQEGRKWHAIECLLDPDAKRGPAPKEVKTGRKAPYRGRPTGGRNSRDDRRGGFKGGAKRGGSKFGKDKFGDAPSNDRGNDRGDDRNNNRKPKFNKDRDDRKQNDNKSEYRSDRKPKFNTANKDERDNNSARPAFKKSYGKKSDSKPYGKKPFGGKKPYVQKSDDTKSENKKTYGGSNSQAKQEGKEVSKRRTDFTKPGKKSFGAKAGSKSNNRSKSPKGGGFDKVKRPSNSKQNRTGTKTRTARPKNKKSA